MKLRYVIPVALFVVFAVILIAKYYEPMHFRPVNQQLANEIRQLQAGDLIVDNSGEIDAVIRQVSNDKIELRSVLNTRYETDIDMLARSPEPVRLIRQGSSEYASCAAAYTKKIRYRPN